MAGAEKRSFEDNCVPKPEFAERGGETVKRRARLEAQADPPTCLDRRLRGAWCVALGSGVRRIRGGSVFQFALFFRFFLLLLLQLFAAFFARVIRSGESLSLWFLDRPGGSRRVFLLRLARSFALLLRLLFLVRLRRFVAHDASTSFAELRCQSRRMGVRRISCFCRLSELAIDSLPPLAFVDRECLLDRGPGVVVDARQRKTEVALRESAATCKPQAGRCRCFPLRCPWQRLRC